MKKFVLFVVTILIVACLTTFVACSGGNDADTKSNDPAVSDQNGSGTNEGASNEGGADLHVHNYSSEVVTQKATYNADGSKTCTCECGKSRTEVIPSLIPTAEVLVEGINEAANATTQGYDFDISLEGNVTVFGFTGSADGTYSGKYRYNATTGSLKFMRETHGKLLPDAKEYVYSQGDTLITMNTDTEDNVKRVRIDRTDDGFSAINTPFLGLVQALGTNNIDNLRKASGKYKFGAQMKFASDAAPLRLLLNKLSKLGSTLAIKDVNFDNPQGGVTLYFNVTDEGVLTDFLYSFHVSFPVAGQNVSLTFTYSQKQNTSDISIPATTGFVTNASEIASEVTAINNAILAVKASNTYSVDMSAVNDLDAGWNKLAVVDKYVARLYKNVNDARVDFNHSYEYQSHTEEDGKETFQYTIGNVTQEENIYLISRKGSNTVTEIENVSADSAFDLLTALAHLNGEDVNVLKKSVAADGTVTYTIYIDNDEVIDLETRILALLNTNTAEGVLTAENYLDEETLDVLTGEYTIAIKDGKLVSCKIETEMRYIPTEGEYAERRVTLKNSAEITIDEKLDKASEYTAPKTADGTLTGLKTAKYYIL